jgi:hypothetical protein
MAREWEKTLSEAYKKLADAVADATRLEVVTRYVAVDDQDGTVVTAGQVAGSAPKLEPKPAVMEAYTRRDLVDGDYMEVVPVQKLQNGKYEIHTELYELHKANTEAARAYVAGLVETLMSAVESLTS